MSFLKKIGHKHDFKPTTRATDTDMVKLPATASPEQKAMNLGLADNKFTWGDGDYATAKQAAIGLAQSGQLSDPNTQKLFHNTFSRIANQRPSDVRNYDFTDQMRREFVNVVKDPKSSPAEKTAARQLYTAMWPESQNWTSNAPTAPGFDPTLDMPAEKAARWAAK